MSEPFPSTDSVRGPRQRASSTPARVLAQSAVEGLLSKKALDVRVIDLRGLGAPAEFFVLATGESELQLRAMLEAVRAEVLEDADEKPWHVEGTDFFQWVVLDYVDLVVHLFLPERRTFYALERLWGDAPFEDVPEDGTGEAVALLQDDARDAPAAPTAAPDDAGSDANGDAPAA